MRAKYFDFEYKQYQTKVKNLTAKYSKVKNRVPCRLIRYITSTEKLKTTITKGNNRQLFLYFELIDAILGTRATSQPMVLVERTITINTAACPSG